MVGPADGRHPVFPQDRGCALTGGSVHFATFMKKTTTMSLVGAIVLFVAATSHAEEGHLSKFQNSAVNDQSAVAADPNDESSQQQWEDDVATASEDAAKLRLRLRIKAYENAGLRALLDKDYAKANSEFKAAVDASPPWQG